MNYPTISIENIRQSLANPLPGVSAQIKMAPQQVENQGNRWDSTSDCRDAGVLILCYPHQSDASLAPELHLILTRRNTYPGVHSGQISLPGGRREGNESLRATALREAEEEIGVNPQSVQVIGQLSSLFTPPSNFCIYPFVAYSPVRPVFYPDAKEVAELLETPLRLLFDPTNYKEETWNLRNFGPRRIPFFDVLGHKVWGATAMILSEFVTVVKRNEGRAW